MMLGASGWVIFRHELVQVSMVVDEINIESMAQSAVHGKTTEKSANDRTREPSPEIEPLFDLH